MANQSRQTRPSLQSLAPVVVEAPARPALCVAWTISRDAACRAFPQVVAAQACDPAGEVELRLRVETDEPIAHLTLTDRDTEHTLGDGPATITPDNDLCHLEARIGEDTFAAVIRGGDVLYATTTLLARCGLGGGRYEVVRTTQV